MFVRNAGSLTIDLKSAKNGPLISFFKKKN